MNRKGQALVEFVIILPIILFLLFALIDFGMISFDRNRMENIVNDVIKMYKNQESKEEINSYVNNNIKDVNINIENVENYTNITLEKKYDFITPGLSKIIGSDFEINIERIVYNGE